VTVLFSLYAQVSVAQRLVLGALGGARAVERRGAALPPPVSLLGPQPCRRSDLNFAPPWQHDQVVRQRALESSVQLFSQGSETNLAMSFMSSWERKARFFVEDPCFFPNNLPPSDCARGGGTTAFNSFERGRRRQQTCDFAETEFGGPRFTSGDGTGSASICSLANAAVALPSFPLFASCLAQATAATCR
jgi:hypothetical protein